MTKCQTQFKFTQDWLIMKTNMKQVIRKYKKNLIKFPVANLPMNGLTKLTITNKD